MTTATQRAAPALVNGKGFAVERVRAEAATGGEGGAAAPAPERAVLYLYDIFTGPDLAFLGGITAGQVVDALAALGDVPEVEVRLNSPGGDLWAGIAVHNALVRFPGRVVVHVDGLAASVASLVALAGDETLVADNAMLMVHRPWTVMAGDAEEMRQMAQILDRAWSAMLTTYAARTGRRGVTIEQKVKDAGGEWWLSAEEAVAEGFADGVEKAEKQAQVFGLERFRKVPARLAAASKDAAPLPLPAQPMAAEIAAPRVTKEPSLGLRLEIQRPGPAAAARRRQVEVLRLDS